MAIAYAYDSSLATTSNTTHTHNESDAMEAINTVNKALAVAKDSILPDLQQQIEYIPADYGTKDQLGENVENSLRELADTVENDIIQPLENIMNNKEKILEVARAIDDKNKPKPVIIQRDEDNATVKAKTTTKPILSKASSVINKSVLAGSIPKPSGKISAVRF